MLATCLYSLVLLFLHISILLYLNLIFLFEILNSLVKFLIFCLVFCLGNSLKTNVNKKGSTTGGSPLKQKDQTMKHSSLPWAEKYRPKAPNDIIGNQSLVCVLVMIFSDFL